MSDASSPQFALAWQLKEMYKKLCDTLRSALTAASGPLLTLEQEALIGDGVTCASHPLALDWNPESLTGGLIPLVSLMAV